MKKIILVIITVITSITVKAQDGILDSEIYSKNNWQYTYSCTWMEIIDIWSASYDRGAAFYSVLAFVYDTKGDAIMANVVYPKSGGNPPHYNMTVTLNDGTYTVRYIGWVKFISNPELTRTVPIILVTW